MMPRLVDRLTARLAPHPAAARTAASMLVPRPALDGTVRDWATEHLQRHPNQARAITYASQVSLVETASSILGAMLGQVEWCPMLIGADGVTLQADEHPAARAYVASMNADRSWASRFGQVFVGAGEAFVTATWQGRNSISWDTLAVTEIDWGARPPRIRRSQRGEQVPVPANTAVMRVFRSSIEWSDVAWSPLMTEQALTLLETELIATAVKLASDKGLLNGGLALLPSEWFASAAPMLLNPDGTVANESQMLSRILQFFDDTASGSGDGLRDRTSPFPVVAPGASLQHARFEQVQAKLNDPEFIAASEHRRQQIASLLPTPDMVLTGVSDMNHWNGVLTSRVLADSQYWAPTALLVARAITREHYRDVLRQLGHPAPHAAIISPDTRPLVELPMEPQTVLAMVAAGLISAEAGRRMLSIAEEDAPGVTAPAASPIVEPTAPTVEPASQRPATPALAAAPSACGGPQRLAAMSSALNRLDAETAAAVTAAADAAVRHAFREIGFSVKRSSKTAGSGTRTAAASLHDGLDVWRIPRIAAAAPPSASDVDAAIATATADLTDMLERMLPGRHLDAQAIVAAAVCAEIGDLPTDDGVPTAMVAAVGGFAARIAQLIRSTVDRAVAGGEATVDVPTVRFGPVRDMLAAAGGTQVVDGIEAVGGGFAAGPWVGRVLGDATGRVAVASFTWRHMHQAAPYPPHLALDGRTASRIAAFGSSFVGDHHGCKCVVETTWRLQ